MNNRQFRISGIYFVFLLVLVYLFSTYVKRMDMENLYTYQQFETAVENGEVVSAVISQSEATPTGTVRLTILLHNQDPIYDGTDLPESFAVNVSEQGEYTLSLTGEGAGHFIFEVVHP